jgi:hypothetical protein
MHLVARSVVTDGVSDRTRTRRHWISDDNDARHRVMRVARFAGMCACVTDYEQERKRCNALHSDVWIRNSNFGRSACVRRYVRVACGEHTS